MCSGGSKRRLLALVRVPRARRAPRCPPVLDAPVPRVPLGTMVQFMLCPSKDIAKEMSPRELHDHMTTLLSTWSIIFALMLSVAAGGLFNQQPVIADGERQGQPPSEAERWRAERSRYVQLLLSGSVFTSLQGLASASMLLAWAQLVPVNRAHLFFSRHAWWMAFTGHITMLSGGLFGAAAVLHTELLLEPRAGEGESAGWRAASRSGYAAYAASGLVTLLLFMHSARCTMAVRAKAFTG
eukprot:TRINITY_DN11856_c0_g1_i1.p2 TRINITY_DN11856_c0_g1~~TRINITY_DN11856_c0_g1_i1.p2  ORF type:complete len:265 (+),score=84.23 TRINITY_DN11856_c0_g1_i1:76-795(+)